MNRSVFFANSAKNYGGAVEVAYTRVNEFQDCRFMNNTVGKMNGGSALRLVVDEWLVSGVVGGLLGGGNRDTYAGKGSSDDASYDVMDSAVLTWQSKVGSSTMRSGSVKRSDIAFGSIWPQLSLVTTSQLDCQAQGLVQTLSGVGALPGTCSANKSGLPNHGRCKPQCETAPLSDVEATCELGIFVWNSTCASSICDTMVPAVNNPCKHGGKCWGYDVARERIQGTDWVVNPVVSGKHIACECAAGWTGALCETPAICETALGPRCHNGATCTAQPGDEFHCACTPGWSGTTCGIALRGAATIFTQPTLLHLLGISVLCSLVMAPITVWLHRQRLQQLSCASQWQGHAAYGMSDGIFAMDSSQGAWDLSTMALSEDVSKGKCRSTLCHRLQTSIRCAQGLLSLISGGWLCALLAAHHSSFLLLCAASTYIVTTLTTVYLGHRTMAHIAEMEGNHVQLEWWSSHFISVGLLLTVSANRLESLYTMPQMLCRGQQSLFPFEPPHIWLLQHAGLYRHLSADVPILLVAVVVFMGGVKSRDGAPSGNRNLGLEACAIFNMV
eukprot:COSAG02_NODE_8495_length_2550_cov_1.324357_3_plen_556_part_01